MILKETMNTINFKSNFKDALIEFASRRTRTHWLTLNCNYFLSNKEALKRLKRWRVEMLRRLHGKHFYRLPENELFQFFGTIEQTLGGKPHFHFACAVPIHLTERFLRHAEQRWLASTPSGSCHIVPIDDKPDSVTNVLGYALKDINPSSAVPFIDSRLFL